VTKRTGPCGLPAASLNVIGRVTELLTDPTPVPRAEGLAYHRHGAGPALVLLHGVGESSVGWRPVLRDLAERYDVISVDLPGFGASPPLRSGITPTAAALADSVERALDELDVARFHVAGYSLGGRVALELGSRDRTRSVVAIAADGLGTPAERLHQAVALLGRRLLARTLAPFADAVAAGSGRWLAFTPDRMRPWLLRPSDARELLSGMATSPGYAPTVTAGLFDIPSHLSDISCPVLILQGTNDPLIGQQAPRFLAAVPDAQLRWLPGLSHIPISDDPAAVAQLLLHFFADADALETRADQR
jgi:pimeloyl-ACP methyl ester carboxylesterase